MGKENNRLIRKSIPDPGPSPGPIFSLTGIPPYQLDFATEFPVLAINIRYDHITNIFVKGYKSRLLPDSFSPSTTKPGYTKQTYFLIADREMKFRWMSQGGGCYFRPELAELDPQRETANTTRYALNKYIGEKKNMLYPVRAFSITGIKMDGFDTGKAYPVLAIDMDQYIPESTEQEEGEIAEQPQSQSIAFFLVGDDSGEFAWIAEDECRLFPLE